MVGARHLTLALCALTVACQGPGALGEPSSEGSGSLGGKADSAGVSGDGEIDWEAIVERCAPPSSDEPLLYVEDFRFGYTEPEMTERFETVYASGQRLFERAYFDAEHGELVLPNLESWGGDVVLARRLVESVRRHIETAMTRGYAEHVFFPDMGHSHLFVPQELWDRHYTDVPVAELSGLYTSLFDDPMLRVLYHTAEQLQFFDADETLIDDPELQWRFYTRNIVGDNQGLGALEIHRDLSERGNTVRAAEGHHYFGAGFNVSASQDGCFPYVHEGRVLYFDLSLSDLPVRNPSPTDF